MWLSSVGVAKYSGVAGNMQWVWLSTVGVADYSETRLCCVGMKLESGVWE